MISGGLVCLIGSDFKDELVEVDEVVFDERFDVFEVDFCAVFVVGDEVLAEGESVCLEFCFVVDFTLSHDDFARLLLIGCGDLLRGILF